MNSSPLALAQANLDLTLLQVEADSMSSSDFYVWLSNSGLSSEIVSGLYELISYTKKVGKKTFNIGKIILLKIIEFVEAHPFLVTGLGIGAVVGGAIATLVTSIPFVGPLLAPVATLLGITITVVGAVIGHNLDKKLPSVGKNVIEIAKTFFSLFADILNALFARVVTA